LAADQVLEAQVVLADGQVVTANACRNSDLYYAIRGGGGGTYGVVISTTVKAYPSVPVLAQILIITPLASSNTSALIDAITDVYSSYPSLNDAGFSGYGTWSINSATPLFGNVTVGFVHTIAAMGANIDGAQAAAAPLLSKLQKYNGTSLSVSASWMSFPTYGDYYNALSGVQQPVGSGDLATSSRLFDGPSLTRNLTALKQMLTTLAGEPDQYTTNSVEIVGGGQVFADANDPYSGVNPAWRISYLSHLVGRGWAPGTDAATIEAIKYDITYTKTEAMRQVAPLTGAYMNEVNHLSLRLLNINPANFSLLRLIKTTPSGYKISTARISHG
jgi:hypothetical protein